MTAPFPGRIPAFALLACVVAGLVVIAGCASLPVDTSSFTRHPASRSSPESGQTGENLPAPTDAQLGRIIADFDAYAENARADWHVPGMAVAVAEGDRIVFAKGYGVKRSGGSDPVTPATVFQIGSLSKAFTAAVLATETDRGTIGWDDRIADLLPGFKMYDSNATRGLTLADALSHRSGLPDHWGEDLWMLGFNRTYIIHALRYAEPVTSYRSEYAYQNVLYMIPVEIMERETGLPWPEILGERIFTPLWMTGSSADLATYLSALDAASPHVYRIAADGSMISVPVPSSSIMTTSTYLEPGAEGINSDADDLARWLIFQMGNGSFAGTRVISEGNMRFLHKQLTLVKAGPAGNQYYCPGWNCGNLSGHAVFWHSGATGGFRSAILFMPETRVGIVILANNGETDLCDLLAWEFYARYFGNSTLDLAGRSLMASKEKELASLRPAVTPPAYPARARALPEYTGTYTNSVYGPAAVTDKDGNLTVMLGPRRITLHLTHLDGDSFLSPPSEFFSGVVVFRPDPEGRVASVSLPLQRETTFSRAAS